LHKKLVEELKEIDPEGSFSFITQCLFQPLPKLYAERSVAVGGNVMGVERHAHNGVLWLAVTMMKIAEHEALAYPNKKAWVQAVKDYAAT
jgi:hypothetical protein